MIQINLLRISPDSEYIEFSVECPENYKFNTLNIKKYDYSTSSIYPTNTDGWIDASNLYQGTTTKEVMRIATSIFGGASIFYLQFGVEWIGEDDETLNSDGTKLSDTPTTGICSDINNVYNYLLQSILATADKCSTISNDLKRNFILLFGHIEAMRLNKFDDAEYFYDILKNNFSNCLTDSRLYTNDCGCTN